MGFMRVFHARINPMIITLKWMVNGASPQLKVSVPPELHRRLALEAAEAGISLNRLASDKLGREDLR